MPQITFRTNLKAAMKALKKFGEGFVTDAENAAFLAALRVQKQMQKPGELVPRKLKWHSLKQMRAYFVTGGFGHGIPYHRTNRYIRGWQVDRVDRGAVVYNNVSYAVDVGGTAQGLDQQPMYQGRWPLFRDVVDRVTALLPKEIKDLLRKHRSRIPKVPK